MQAYIQEIMAIIDAYAQPINGVTRIESECGEFVLTECTLDHNEHTIVIVLHFHSKSVTCIPGEVDKTKRFRGLHASVFKRKVLELLGDHTKDALTLCKIYYPNEQYVEGKSLHMELVPLEGLMITNGVVHVSTPSSCGKF